MSENSIETAQDMAKSSVDSSVEEIINDTISVEIKANESVAEPIEHTDSDISEYYTRAKRAESELAALKEELSALRGEIKELRNNAVEEVKENEHFYEKKFFI